MPASSAHTLTQNGHAPDCATVKLVVVAGGLFVSVKVPDEYGDVVPVYWVPLIWTEPVAALPASGAPMSAGTAW